MRIINKLFDLSILLLTNKKLRQERHLDGQLCLHDDCLECSGTGIKKEGGACIHNLACFFPKCSLR